MTNITGRCLNTSWQLTDKCQTTAWLFDDCLMIAYTKMTTKPLRNWLISEIMITIPRQQQNSLAYESVVSCMQPKNCSCFETKICITNHSALELAFFMRSKPAHWGKVSCDKHHWPSPHICGLIYTTPYPSSSVRLIGYPVLYILPSVEAAQAETRSVWAEIQLKLSQMIR